jgi:hypothetical protein
MGGQLQNAIDKNQRHKGHKGQGDEKAALTTRLGGDRALAEGIARASLGRRNVQRRVVE